MSKYTLKEIQDAKELAQELKLKGYELFCSLPDETLQKYCNGIGAEWMPAASRALLDKRFPVIKIAAMIHDIRFNFGDGTDEDFKEANNDLFENGWLLGCHYFPWHSPVRYLVWFDAKRLARVCQKFGRKAYNEAIASHKLAEEQEAMQA